LGNRLLGHNGWDQYLEDPASLWLLHWNIVRGSAAATAWHFAFTVFPELNFTTELLSAALASFALTQFPNARTASSSFQKDSTCIVRMYAEVGPGAQLSEETIQSPFAELGLVKQDADLDAKRSKRYRFEIGPKSGLVPEIVAAACLEFADRIAPGSRTVGLSRLLSEAGSPGMAFKLGESSLSAYLEDASRLGLGMTFGDAAGLIQLAFDGPPADLAWQFLHRYYAGIQAAAIHDR
jgi:hypothetical protein